MTTITRDEAVSKIRNFEDGRIFTVVFFKRTTGERRVMNCRQRVTKHLKGGDAAYSFKEKGLVSVFDMQKGAYRCFAPDALIEIRCEGETFQVV